MRRQTAIAFLALLLLLGCSSVVNPFQISVTHFSDGSTAANITYPSAGNGSIEYNLSRYLYAYYYSYADPPYDQTVVSISFDLCGYENGGSYPTNIRFYYPQFGGEGNLIYPGALNGCTHISANANELDALISMNASPLECCERENRNKFEERYPRVYNTTEEVELALWNNSEDIRAVNYTCFEGDSERLAFGEPLARKNSTYGSPSIFNFTCPAYGAEGLYKATVYRVATFNGATYEWKDSPGTYTYVLIVDGGSPEVFPLRMQFSSESAGILEVKGLAVRYNNRIYYDGGESTLQSTASTPIWAARNTSLLFSVLEAETDLEYSSAENCYFMGVSADHLNCTDSRILWSELSDSEVEGSEIKYVSTGHLNAWNSSLTGFVVPFSDARGAILDNLILYDGIYVMNFTRGEVPPVGEANAGGIIAGCNGTNAVWVFDGISVIAADIRWVEENDCLTELVGSSIAFSGNANIIGDANFLLLGSEFALYGLNNALYLKDASFEMDNDSLLIIYNSSVVLKDSLALAGRPTFAILENGALNFSNLGDVYPEICIGEYNESDGEACFTDIRFLDYGPEYPLTSDYIIGEGFISFNDEAMPYIDETPARISLYGVRDFEGVVYYYDGYAASASEVIRRGEPCPPARCTNINYDADSRTLTFDVSGLSSYAAGRELEEEKSLKGMEVRVSAGCAGEEAIFSSIEGVWIDIDCPSGKGLCASLKTNSSGKASFVPSVAGQYRYFANKAGYQEARGSFSVGECPSPEENETLAGLPPSPLPSSAEEIAPSAPLEEDSRKAPPEEKENPPSQPLEKEVVGEGAPAAEEGQGREGEGAPKEECPALIGICWQWWLIGAILALAGAVAFWLLKMKK
ncbi:MAG: hypothetical protein QXH30_01075 [Candidatus Bilamarchaeaceae archaeon]